jgi:hypothetical protein
MCSVCKSREATVTYKDPIRGEVFDVLILNCITSPDSDNPFALSLQNGEIFPAQSGTECGLVAYIIATLMMLHLREML